MRYLVIHIRKKNLNNHYVIPIIMKQCIIEHSTHRTRSTYIIEHSTYRTHSTYIIKHSTYHTHGYSTYQTRSTYWTHNLALSTYKTPALLPVYTLLLLCTLKRTLKNSVLKNILKNHSVTITLHYHYLTLYSSSII